nr:methyltransferase [Candidatus Sigynarchaeota archaeon]
MKEPFMYKGISLEIPRESGIYVPSDDSCLLLDLVNDFLQGKQKKFAPAHALDMGAGSGIITYILARQFKHVDAVDININAINFINQEAKKQGLSGVITVIKSDMLTSVPFKRYALACFNPPYLPVEGDSDEALDVATLEGRDLLDVALYSPDGGSSLLRRFLFDVKARLEDEGHVFFIKSSHTSFQDFHELLKKLGYEIAETRCVHKFFEDIEAYHVVA